jgi:hypothetical protein
MPPPSSTALTDEIDWTMKTRANDPAATSRDGETCIVDIGAWHSTKELHSSKSRIQIRGLRE